MVIKFLKSLFAKEEQEVVVRNMSLSELKKSLSEGSYDSVLDVINEKIKEFEKEKLNLKNKVSNLRNAELRNKNIPKRAKQVAEGNKEMYCSKNEAFGDFEIIALNIPKVKKSCEQFNYQLTILNKTTSRSYFVLQEFFANESNNVVKVIKNLDNIVKQIQQEIESANINKKDELKNKIVEFESKISAKKDFEKEAKETKLQLEKKNKSFEKSKKELESFKDSPEFLEKDKLTDKRKNIQKEISLLSTSIYHHFAVIEKALKKYERISIGDSILSDYVADPIKTLLSDSDLKIIGLIQNLKNMIDKLDLKDKKKIKTMESLTALSKETLSEFRKNCESLQKKLKEIDMSISENKIVQKMDKKQLEISRSRAEMDVLEKKLNSIMSSIKGIDSQALKKSIEEFANSIFDYEVVLND